MVVQEVTPDKAVASARQNIVVGSLVYGAAGLGFIAANEEWRNWVLGNLVIVGIGLTVTIAILLLIWFRIAFLARPATQRIGLLVFAIAPALLVVFAAIAYAPAEYEVGALRAIFLLIVTFLPAMMYYLFIVSRKRSLLQEFFTNINRLGLLGRRHDDERERRVRVMTYIQKFEAVYGPIPSDVAESIIEETDPGNAAPEVPKFHGYATGKNVGVVFTAGTALPVVIATILIFMGWLLALPPWQYSAEEINAQSQWYLVLSPLTYTVNFAFLGAYFFSLQMLYRRYVRNDLRANAYVSVSMRIILAVIGIWVTATAFEFINPGSSAIESGGAGILVVAFVVGAFPSTAWQVAEAAFQKITLSKFFVPSLESVMPVSDLDGLTVWHQTRLEEEDIENVPNMATADLVELFLNTKFPPDRIVDWVDQAILYTALGPEVTSSNEENDGKDESQRRKTSRELLREHGIRTASSFIRRYDYTKTKLSKAEFAQYLALLPSGANSRMESLGISLGTNTNLELIQNWKNTSSSGQKQAEPAEPAEPTP